MLAGKGTALIGLHVLFSKSSYTHLYLNLNNLFLVLFTVTDASFPYTQDGGDKGGRFPTSIMSLVTGVYSPAMNLVIFIVVGRPKLSKKKSKSPSPPSRGNIFTLVILPANVKPKISTSSLSVKFSNILVVTVGVWLYCNMEC